jgi:general secretion pathway protein L
MTLEELLNSEMDFQSLAALARQGFDWWIDELAAMAPPAWRARLRSGPRVWAGPEADGAWRFWRDGRPLADAATPGDARIGLLLPARSVLVREISTPRMPIADVRRMAALDIDRLSPLAPGLIHFDLEVLDRDARGAPTAAGQREGGQRVAVGIVPRTVAAALWTEARALGLNPVAMAARTDDGGMEGRRFDFLPAVRAAAGDTAEGKAARWWWAAVAALLAANVAVLVGRDILNTRRLADLVDAQGPAVTAVQTLRRRVEAEDRRRVDLVARARRTEPLRMLNALTEALPAGAWVQRLEWNGQTLHIVGERAGSIDMNAAIRGSGAFVNPRAATGEPAASGAASRSYDITADARSDAPRADAALPGGRP